METTDNLKSEALLELIFFAESKETENEVINAILPAYLRKLNCFMAGVLKRENSALSVKQVLPFTFKKEGALEFIFEYIRNKSHEKHQGFCELTYEGNYFYIYCLSGYGFLILGRKKPFDFLFKNEFKFVVNFLGKVISQSVEDQRRKEAEKRLTEERLLLRTIIDNIPINIYAKDLNYRKTLANASELRFLGINSEDEVLGKTDEDLYGKSISANTFIEDQLVLVNGESILGEEKPMGNDQWALISKLPLKNEKDEIMGLVGISIDYTERRKTQEQLSIFLNLFDNISDAVQVITETGELFYLNKVAGEQLGIDPLNVNGFIVTDYLMHFPTIELWNEHVDNLKNQDHLTIERLYVNIKTKVEISVEVTVKFIEVNGKGFVVANSRDISDRKKIENELRASEGRKASLIASMSDLVFVLDNNLRFIEYHIPKGVTLFFKPQRYVGQVFSQIKLPKAPRELIQNILANCLENETNSKTEIFFDTACGRIWYDLSATILKDQLGNKGGVTCVARDITYRKQREEIIRQQLRMQDLLIKVSTTYINIDLNKVEETIQLSLKELGEFVEADRAYIFDYDFNDSTTSNTYEWCADGIVPEIDLLQKVPLEKLPNFVRKHKVGEAFYVADVSKLDEKESGGVKKLLQDQHINSLISFPMMNGDELLGFVGFDSVRMVHSYNEKEKTLLEVFSQMLVNVIERKRNEALLIRQEEKYRNIITNMNLGIIEVDHDENIMYANQSFCSISGYNESELKSMKATQFLLEPEDKTILEEKHELRNKGVSDGYELAVKNKNGEPRWWFVSGAPNYNDKNELTGSIGIHLDITDQKKLEKELENAIIVAEDASKAKEVFLANMSHEIRTPLNVITGMVRELAKEKLNEKQMSYVNHSETAAYHLLTIVNNILDMSKIEAGEFELENRDFSLSAVATDVRSILYSKAQEKGLELRIVESPDIKPALVGDAGRLRQIFINLIGNSLKFTEKGSVELKLSVISTNKYYQRILFEITDTGIGMSEKFMKKLFDKFSQEQGEANRKFEGTGLGMSITKELVQLMGANIQASSMKGVGTVVSFELNLPIGNIDKIVEINTLAKKDSFSGVKILLVEDNEMNRFIAIQSLNFVGCVVDEAENGLIALEKLKSNNYDLVLMDIQMPEMDGVEATKQIRAVMKKNVPIVALTANAFKHDIDLYLSVGMNDYLIKPYREVDLYNKIGSYVNYVPQSISQNLEKEKMNEQLKDIEIMNEINSTQSDSIVPLYDLKQISEIGRGDVGFIQSMTRIFKGVANQAIIQFRNNLDANDIESIRKLAHKIKPSIDNMMIVSLKDKIRILEKFGIEENDFELENLIDEVCDVLQQVVDDLP